MYLEINVIFHSFLRHVFSFFPCLLGSIVLGNHKMQTIRLPKSKVLSYFNLAHIVACTTKVNDY